MGIKPTLVLLTERGFNHLIANNYSQVITLPVFVLETKKCLYVMCVYVYFGVFPLSPVALLLP